VCFWGYELDKLTFHARLAFINWRESFFEHLLWSTPCWTGLHPTSWMLIGLLLFLFPSIKSDNGGSIASNAIPKHDPCSSMGSGHKWQRIHTLEYCLCFVFPLVSKSPFDFCRWINEQKRLANVSMEKPVWVLLKHPFKVHHPLPELSDWTCYHVSFISDWNQVRSLVLVRSVFVSSDHCL
jgi:hypothetical protein